MDNMVLVVHVPPYAKPLRMALGNNMASVATSNNTCARPTMEPHAASQNELENLAANLSALTPAMMRPKQLEIETMIDRAELDDDV